MRKTWRCLIVFLVALLTVAAPYTTQAALNPALEDEFAEYGIIFYNPDDSPVAGGFSSCGRGAQSNLDYAGSSILNETQLATINDYRPFYEKVGSETSIPWAIFAVIHLRESGLSRVNPNSDGLFQIVANEYEDGAAVDDAGFESQLHDAAAVIHEKVSGTSYEAGLAIGDEAAVKWLFFSYNGTAGVYVQQALDLGFTQAQADVGEGSPYVMNRADAQRDPTIEPTKSNGTWGQIKRDHGSIEYPANSDYGAFVVYASLSGCTISEGGLTEEAALTLMMNYGANIVHQGQNSLYWIDAGPGTPALSAPGGRLSNCVAFSAFFMNKFSATRYHGGDGRDVVANLRAAGVPTGTEPGVFAIFSWPNAGPGHTGVILGIRGDTAIVGHASYSNTGTGRGNGRQEGGGAGYIRVGPIDEPWVWQGRVVPTEFAYPEMLDGALIEDYLNAAL